MASLDLAIYLSGTIGLVLVAGFSFSMYYNHRIPQFLVLGFALVPFAILALFFRTADDSFYKELGLYAAVIAMMLIIGFAIGVFYPKFLELQYFLPFVLFTQLLGLFAAITRHETSYDFSEIIFVIPLLSAAMVAMGLVTWKFYRLKVPQLTMLLFSFFLGIFLAGFLLFFNPLFGYAAAAYLAFVCLIIIGRTNNPEALASLYREYLLLP
ncbi:MAG: hypothetical protein ACXACI_13515, partial [Candidatus Hodarchaeales archaeon]